MRKMQNINKIALILGVSVLFTACSEYTSSIENTNTSMNKVTKEEVSMSTVDKSIIEQYKKDFDTIKCNNTLNKDIKPIDSYKKAYYYLVHDFILGSFNKPWYGLNYLDSEYNTEGYRFCLQDLNDDGIPEFILYYEFDNKYDYMYDIFEAKGNNEYYYVGSGQYFDSSTNTIFSASKDYSIIAQEFNGEELVDKFSYYIEEPDYCDSEECSDNDIDYETYYIYEDNKGNKREISQDILIKAVDKYLGKPNIRFDWKRLTVENVAKELDIDVDAWAYECALRSYLIILYDLSDNTYNNYYKYCLIYADNDNIPELITYKDFEVNIYFYKNGKVYKASAFPDSAQADYRFSYFPKTGVFRYKASIDDSTTDKYFIIYKDDLNTLVNYTTSTSENIITTKTYRVDNEIVNKDTYDELKLTMEKEFNLTDDIRLEDTDSYILENMITYIETLIK